MTFSRWLVIVLLAITLQWLLGGIEVVCVWEDWSYILSIHGLRLHCSPWIDCRVAFG